MPEKNERGSVKGRGKKSTGRAAAKPAKRPSRRKVLSASGLDAEEAAARAEVDQAMAGPEEWGLQSAENPPAYPDGEAAFDQAGAASEAAMRVATEAQDNAMRNADEAARAAMEAVAAAAGGPQR